MSKSKKKTKNIKVRDIKPKKDAKGGGTKSTTNGPLGGTGGLGVGGGGLTGTGGTN